MADMLKMLAKTAEMPGCFWAEVKMTDATYNRCVCRDNGKHGLEVWWLKKKKRAKEGEQTHTLQYDTVKQDRVRSIKPMKD